MTESFPNVDAQYGIFSSYHASAIINRYDNEQSGKTSGVLKLYAYQAGPIAFAAAPYEMFDTNGVEIKNNSTGSGKFAMTFIATLANGSEDYIPSQISYTNGSYAVDVTRYAAGTGEQLRDAYITMINGMAD